MDSNFDLVPTAAEKQNITHGCKTDSNRQENDAEHSWSLAYIFLSLQRDLEQEFGQLYVEKILKLFIIHDIGELEGGDTPTWNKTSMNKISEHNCAKAELSDKMCRPDLFELCLETQEQPQMQSLEVKIVKSIDTIDPILLRINTKEGWKTIHESEHTTKAELHKRQLPRHQFSKTMTNLYLEIVKIVQTNNYLN